MKTFVLFWNPAISSYKLDDLQREMEEVADYDNNMNWSVWEHEQASAGDRFFMVRCGSGNTGICMSGYFSSNPYKSEDWSGRGRITYYMNLDPDVMIHPDYLPILGTGELIAAIPSFDWKGGHSGRLLEACLAEKLETLWAEFLEKNKEIFICRAIQRELNPSDYTTENEEKITIYVDLTDEGKINAYHGGLNLDIDADDVETVKKLSLEYIHDLLDRPAEVVFDYDDVEEKDVKTYEKVFDIVSKNKKGGEDFEFWGESDEKAVYLLHQVSVTPQYLQEQGIPPHIVDAIRDLTRKEGETYSQYVMRAVKNTLVRNILREEIREKLDIRDFEEIKEQDLAEINEALKAWHYLRVLDQAEKKK